MVGLVSKNKIWFFTSLILAAGIIFGGFFFIQNKKGSNFSNEKPSGIKSESNLSLNPNLLAWQEIVSNAPWSGRDAHSTIIFKDKIWLFGGVEGGSTEKSPVYEKIPHKSDIWVSEDGTNWQLIKEKAEWGERRSMTTVVFKDKIWFLGGWTADFGETKNDIWVSEDGVSWEMVLNSAPWEKREGHTAIVFKDKIWMAGGVNFYERKTYNDVWYSEDGVNWTEAASSAPWTKRYDHTLTVFKDKLWLIGGLDFGNQVKKDVWVSEDGINWQLASDNPAWLPRHGHISLEYKDRLWIIGGWSETADKGLNDTWYSEDGYSWNKTKKDGPWLGREDHTGIVFQDKIWIMGGMADAKEKWVWKNDIWRSTFPQL